MVATPITAAPAAIRPLWWANRVFSGECSRGPLTNSSVSSRRALMYRPTGPTRMPTKNGTRQPHE